MSTLMSTMSNLLADFSWVDTLTKAMTNVLVPILTLVAFAGLIYAIVVGVKFAKADDKSQRDEAKQKLITVIVGIVVTAVLIALFFWLASSLKDGGWLNNIIKGQTDNGGTGSEGEEGVVAIRLLMSFIS